jgi:hypothetical protein
MMWRWKYTPLVVDRLGEAARETAILWFVFSALDALISHGLTFGWFSSNTSGAIAVWVLGMYLEIVAKELQ